MKNKSLITNILALSLMIFGQFSPFYGEEIFITGLFAFSGGVTNWIAIHMLFEKVPFLYGSGIIPNKFEEFKKGIKTLIIEEFFTKEHIEKFFEDKNISANSINDKINFDKIFGDLTDAIMESSMGSMVQMFGGKNALQPLKEPITNKLKSVVDELVNNKNEEPNSNFVNSLMQKVEKIIDNRLEELTPEMVKQIIQKMIRQHLGWLVVWGGLFGGLIGLAFAVLGQ